MSTQVDDVEALRRFVAGAIDDDMNIAVAAGHGFGHLSVGALERDGTQPDWTRLDLADNVRPTYDVRFARRFSPDEIAADYERKAAIVEVADVDVLLVLANEFHARTGFDPAWARTPLNGRQLGDRLTALRSRAVAEGAVVVRAGDLRGRHVGLLATLPGRIDAGVWVDTTAPINQVLHRKDGRVKVRRHPDGHVDHTFDPDTALTLVVPGPVT